MYISTFNIDSIYYVAKSMYVLVDSLSGVGSPTHYIVHFISAGGMQLKLLDQTG